MNMVEGIRGKKRWKGSHSVTHEVISQIDDDCDGKNVNMEIDMEASNESDGEPKLKKKRENLTSGDDIEMIDENQSVEEKVEDDSLAIVCSECGEMFVAASNLATHILTKHRMGWARCPPDLVWEKTLVLRK